MSKLPLIIFGTPAWHLGLKQLKWLAEAHSTTVANSGIEMDALGFPCGFLECKHIIPIFGYPESWAKARATYDYWRDVGFLDCGNVYYHNCGDGSWAGLDEPGSRSDIPDKAFSLGRAYQEVKDTLNLMPGLKPVVTHPADARFKEFGTQIVYAFQLTLLMAFLKSYGENYWVASGYPAGAEVWAYLNAANLDALAVSGEWGKVGAQMRDVGASCLLINTLGGITKHLYANGKPTAALEALWGGLE